MSDIYLVQGGLSSIDVLDTVPDLPMWVQVFESESEELKNLPPRKYDIEHIPEKMFYGRDGEVKSEAFYKVSLRKGSFYSSASALINTLIESDKSDDSVMIESRGNMNSDRTAIYNAARDLGVKVSVRKSNKTFIISLAGKAGSHREPNWWTKVKKDKGHPVVLKFKGRLTSFRSKIYAWAKRQKRRVTVIPGNEPQTVVVTYHGKRDDSKPMSEQFNELIYSLPYDTPSDVPEWLSSKSDATIRVMCSNHSEALSYRGGKLIRYAPPTPHRSPSDNIGNTGDFVYDGKNYGKRSDKWIEIFMKSRGEK